MKVAIVHYWLVTMRGGEKVLEALCDIFPQADIYTNVYDPSHISDKIKAHKVYTYTYSLFCISGLEILCIFHGNFAALFICNSLQ